MSAPAAVGKAVEQLDNHLLAENERLRVEQLDLRMQKSQQSLEHAKQLFVARQVNEKVTLQLNQEHQLVSAQTQTITHLESQLRDLNKEKEALLEQLDQKVDQLEQQGHHGNDLQKELDSANQRVETIEKQLADARISANQTLELCSHYNRFFQIVNRANELNGKSPTQGLGMGVGALVGGAPGAIIGNEVSGLVTFFTSCTELKRLSAERTKVVAQIYKLHFDLKIQIPEIDFHVSFWT